MTANLRGRHSVRLDTKGRFILPASFRNSSQSKTSKPQSFFITNNIHRGQQYLDLVPEKEWLAFEKRISRMPQMKADVQAFRRFYLASAVPVKTDGQGRLLVPPELRDFAGLSENMILLGVGSKIEIWNNTEWSKFQKVVVENYDSILEAVSNFEEEDD